MADMGYDVSDYCAVDPMFGTLEDFDALVAEAHRQGLKVIIDQVLSHTSDKHPWFVESRADRTNAKADWYVWADAKPDGTAPNNWLSVFGGSAWEWDSLRRQYYLHNFLASQPDLNFHNPEVQDALLDAVRFWLERGVDGFRLDTVNYYFHDRWLRDNPPLAESMAGTIAETNPYLYQSHLFDKTQPENLDFLKRFRALLDEYEARASVGEVGDETRSLQTVAAYTGGGDKLHMCYTFDLLGPQFSAAHVRGCVEAFEKIRRRWLGVLGVLQPRRDAPCLALDAARRGHRCRRQIRDRAACLPARLDLPLSGRGTRPDGGRDRLRGSARPLWHPLLAGLQGPGRLPHADGVGGRRGEWRVFDGQALAAGARRHRSRAADVQEGTRPRFFRATAPCLRCASAIPALGARLDRVPRRRRTTCWPSSAREPAKGCSACSILPSRSAGGRCPAACWSSTRSNCPNEMHGWMAQQSSYRRWAAMWDASCSASSLRIAGRFASESV